MEIDRFLQCLLFRTGMNVTKYLSKISAMYCIRVRRKTYRLTLISQYFGGFGIKQLYDMVPAFFSASRTA